MNMTAKSILTKNTRGRNRSKSSDSESQSQSSQSRSRVRRSQSNPRVKKGKRAISESSDESDKPAKKIPVKKRLGRKANDTIEEVADEDMESAQASSQIQTDSNASDPDNDRIDLKKSRAYNRNSVHANAYDAACSKLQLSTIPDVLPCRD